MDMQAILNALSAAGTQQRQSYHLPLGKLIEALERADPNVQVRYDVGGAPCDPHSYRGYYEDLAFETDPAPCTAGEFLAECRSTHGTTLEGYKGGDFLMGDKTVLWSSSYGHSGGRAIVGTEMRDGALVLLTREVD